MVNADAVPEEGGSAKAEILNAGRAITNSEKSGIAAKRIDGVKSETLK